MPKDAVYVGRPSRYGNPFRVGLSSDGTTRYTAEDAVRKFEWLLGRRLVQDPAFLDRLRGRDVVCWCRLDAPCHGDVLLKYANKDA